MLYYHSRICLLLSGLNIDGGVWRDYKKELASSPGVPTCVEKFASSSPFSFSGGGDIVYPGDVGLRVQCAAGGVLPSMLGGGM